MITPDLIENLLEMLFEKFRMNQIHITTTLSSVLYYNNDANGIVIDCGHEETQYTWMLCGYTSDQQYAHTRVGGQ